MVLVDQDGMHWRGQRRAGQPSRGALGEALREGCAVSSRPVEGWLTLSTIEGTPLVRQALYGRSSRASLGEREASPGSREAQRTLRA